MRTTLISLTVIFLMNFCHAQINLQNGLVACYEFNGNADNLAGTVFHGTVSGATVTTDRFGNANSAYEFDGVNDFINLGTDFDYPDRTVNLWFNADVDNSIQVMFGSDHPGLQNGFLKFLVVVSSGIKKLRMNAGQLSQIYERTINENQWYMATICKSSNSSEVRYYVNGQLEFTGNTSTSTSQTGNSYASIGKSYINDRYFNGKIDDLRVYNRCLDIEEINLLYNGANCTVTTNLNTIESRDNEILIYPNPMTDIVSIKYKNPYKEKHTLYLYDNQGKLCHTIFNVKTGLVTLEREDLKPGLYYLQISSNSKILRAKKIQIL